jgi:hypothetical protein
MEGQVLRKLVPVSRAGRALTVGAALLSVGAALSPAGTAVANTGTEGRHRVDKVTLGDSYASAPPLPTQVDATCLRPDLNYPSLVARSGSAALNDVSCAGATTEDMTVPQTPSTGAPTWSRSPSAATTSVSRPCWAPAPS